MRIFLVNLFPACGDQPSWTGRRSLTENIMKTLRNILLTAFAASVLAGCQTTSPQQRDCDLRKPGHQQLQGGKCCDASTDCYMGRGGDTPNDGPGRDPAPQ